MTAPVSRSGPPYRFGAPWGGLLKGMTLLGSSILVGIPLVGLVVKPPGAEPFWSLSMVVMPLAVLGITALTAIRGYTVTSEAILVERPGRRSRIDMREIEAVEVDPRAMTGSLRTFGNGGLFGFSGHFRNPRLGGYVAYATDPNRAVVVKTRKRTLVVTPDDPAEFAAAVEHLRRR